MTTLLVADIGGTNSRFAAFRAGPDGGLTMGESEWLKTTAVGSFPELLDRLWAGDFPLAPGDVDMAVFAVAGPIRKKVYCSPPNIDWDIDASDSRRRFGLPAIHLINDFAAQAYACRTPAVADAETLQAGEANPEGAVAVIGAGTGLGHCALMPVGRVGFTAIPSEAGHAAFPFVGEREEAYGAFLRKRLGTAYAIGDHVVSGRGLALAHEFLTGETLSPAEVAAKLRSGVETLEWFARFYGRAARNYALYVLSTGGLYVAGGVAAKNREIVRHPAFLDEFRLSENHAELLAAMPVSLNANESSGLYGAAFYGLLALSD